VAWVREYHRDAWGRILHGNALAWLLELDSGSVDALITDPPYSSGGMVRGDRMNDVVTKYVQTDSANRDLTTFGGDNRDQMAYLYWCSLWLGEAVRVVKPGGAIALFTDWRQLAVTIQAVQVGGFIWRGIVPWYKPASRPQSGRPQASCEYVVWGTNGPAPIDYTAEVLPGFYSCMPPREREHITQKPLEVCRGLVKLAPRGGTVLDLFGGAGTIGVASVIERRRHITVEQSEHFCRVSYLRHLRSLGHQPPEIAQGALDLDVLADTEGIPA
jgi:site-specific DNA-methyltransferase (adenine-specific)